MSLHSLEGQLEGVGTAWPREKWEATLALVMGLLARTWTASHSPVIKSDCALLLPTLLRSYPGPCIMMSCGLRDFVASVLSCPTRRAWASTRLDQMMRIAPIVDVRVSFDLSAPANSAEAAALLWWWQNGIFREAVSAYPGIPTYFLCAEEFLDDPATHLAASLRALGASVESPDRRPLLDQVLRRDAKDPQRIGSAEQRAGKLAASRLLYGAAIEAAIRTVSARIGADVENAMPL
ncbi:MAG TPA: hypothetical protein VMB73_15425 [Acetobacteraceae bacterium]|nr:hypothetical protein [Acetobacteraceae bacterium]